MEPKCAYDVLPHPDRPPPRPKLRDSYKEPHKIPAWRAAQYFSRHIHLISSFSNTSSLLNRNSRFKGTFNQTSLHSARSMWTSWGYSAEFSNKYKPALPEDFEGIEDRICVMLDNRTNFYRINTNISILKNELIWAEYTPEEKAEEERFWRDAKINLCHLILTLLWVMWFGEELILDSISATKYELGIADCI